MIKQQYKCCQFGPGIDHLSHLTCLLHLPKNCFFIMSLRKSLLTKTNWLEHFGSQQCKTEHKYLSINHCIHSQALYPTYAGERYKACTVQTQRCPEMSILSKLVKILHKSWFRLAWLSASFHDSYSEDMVFAPGQNLPQREPHTCVSTVRCINNANSSADAILWLG